MAKKKIDEDLELEDEILDEEEFDEDIDDVEDFDDIDEIDEVDDEVDDEKPSKKASKKKGKGPKKKLSKGKKAAIAVSVIAGVALIAVLVVFVIMPALLPPAVVSNNTTGILSKSGYQKYIEDTSKIRLSKDATEDHIVTVQEMLDATGLSMSNSADQVQIAANIFNLAVTNYANVADTAWYCYTDSSVYADNVKAKLGISLSFASFNVGVRSAYMLTSQETTNAKNEGDSNSYSSTISGVTVLDIDGLPDNLTNTVKGLFGYNIQSLLYEGTYAFRRGNNGGAQFFGDESEEGYKYAMGAYNASFPTKINTAKNEVGEYKQGSFVVKEYNKEEDSSAHKLDTVDTPIPPVVTRTKAWDPLQKTYSYGYKINVYGTDYVYYSGNYGVGWASYDFSVDNLASTTSVTYDKNTHVYTIKMVVKPEKANEACEFAKGSLMKDTKDYITMQNPEYSLEENTIEIFDNGLIKSWKRQEKVSSDKKAQLIILSGDCFNGGGTTNITQQAFSYLPEDTNPLANAALYWPELGQSSVVGNLAFNLSAYPTLAQYNPSKNN